MALAKEGSGFGEFRRISRSVLRGALLVASQSGAESSNASVFAIVKPSQC